MTFEERLRELISYRAEHGEDPPVRQSGQLHRLGQWLNRQRYLHRKGELSPERVRQLTEAGIQWEPSETREAQSAPEAEEEKEGQPETAPADATPEAVAPTPPSDRGTGPVGAMEGSEEGGEWQNELPSRRGFSADHETPIPAEGIPPVVAGLGMASGHDTPEISAWNLAKELIEKGVRPPAAASMTGLPQEAMRRLYKQVHRRESKRGPSPYYARSLIDNTRRAAHGAMAVEVYRTLTTQAGDPRGMQIDPWALLRAHDVYVSLLPEGEPPMGLESCWYLLRDLRIGDLRLQFCPSCQTTYLYSLQQESLLRCPYCAPYLNRGSAPDR